jgi:hypothetical protein
MNATDTGPVAKQRLFNQALDLTVSPFIGDSTCYNGANPSTCQLCAFLSKVVPSLVNSDTLPVMWPIFKVRDVNNQLSDTDMYSNNTHIKHAVLHLSDDHEYELDPRLLLALAQFTDKWQQKQPIRQLAEIPMILYINVVEGTVFAHCYIMVIAHYVRPGETELNPLVYTYGLGQNKETGKVTIRSPDFNPFIVEKHYDKEFKHCDVLPMKIPKFGKLIIKGIEPFSRQHVSNLEIFLVRNIVKVDDMSYEADDYNNPFTTEPPLLTANVSTITGTKVQSIDKRNIRTKNKTKMYMFLLNTDLDYHKYNVSLSKLYQSPNCATFAQHMSTIRESRDTSIITDLMYGLVQNPSSMRINRRISNSTELTTFIDNVINDRSDLSIQYLLQLHDRLDNYSANNEISCGISGGGFYRQYTTTNKRIKRHTKRIKRHTKRRRYTNK